jgi:hypothetical protein
MLASPPCCLCCQQQLDEGAGEELSVNALVLTAILSSKMGLDDTLTQPLFTHTVCWLGGNQNRVAQYLVFLRSLVASASSCMMPGLIWTHYSWRHAESVAFHLHDSRGMVRVACHPPGPPPAHATGKCQLPKKI